MLVGVCKQHGCFHVQARLAIFHVQSKLLMFHEMLHGSNVSYCFDICFHVMAFVFFHVGV